MSFFYAIFVVMLHSYWVGSFSIDAQSGGFDGIVYYLQNIISQDLVRCAIPTFFAISGFLFFAKVRTIQDVFNGMKKRFFSLAVPYLIANIIYTVLEAVYRMVLMDETAESFMSGCDSIGEFLFRSVFLFHYNMAGWYLFALMLWVMLTPILFYVMKSKIASVAALITFFALGVFEPFHIPHGKNYTLFFFFLGAFIAVYGMHFVNRPMKRNRMWIPIVLLLISQLLVAGFGFYTTMGASHLIRFVFEILISVAIWYLSDLLIDKVTVKSYYKYSFPIYIWHPIILTYAKYFVERPGITYYGGFACMICFTIFCFISSVIPICLFHYLERKIKPVYRLMTGGR